MKESFLYQDICFFYKHKNVKYLRLKLLPEDEFMLSIPKSCSKAELFSFLDKNMKEIKALKASIKPLSKDELCIFGKNFKLEKAFKAIKIKDLAKLSLILNALFNEALNKEKIRLKLPFKQKAALKSYIYKNPCKIYTKDFLEALLKKYELYMDENTLIYTKKSALLDFSKMLLIPALKVFIAIYERALLVKVASFSIRAFKRTWGSCKSSQAKLKFAQAALHLSPALLQYLVLHEVVHIKEANHGKAFYQLLAKNMIDFKKREHILKNQAKALIFFSII